MNSASNQAVGGLKVFCVIPAWNEGKNLPAVLEQVKPLVYETVVVDDGSTDETYKLAEASGVTALRHIINRGQGAALRTGTEYALEAGADVIVHFDADGQFLAEEIAEVVAPIIRGEAEMVFGSRFLDKRSAIPGFKKAVILPLARLVNRVFLNVRTTDPQSGFRAFSRRAAASVKWHQDDMAHCSEIIYAASRSGLTIKEVPMTVVYHKFGSGFTRGFRILKDLFISRLIN
jgi:glycosyltransferase involved in cell wall biosynthesis